MLENCVELQNCEILLAESVKDVRLLGEVPLTDQDIEILVGMVKEVITPDISKGTRTLKARYPTCFACFLVSMGRFYDKLSGFWPIVEKKVGPIDINWQVKWGKAFIRFLEQHGLPRFDEEEGLTYVTPILGHACIPDSCLNEYFDRILVPLVNRDLLNPIDQEEIIQDLRFKRKINHSRLELEQKTKEQSKGLGAVRNASRKLQEQLDAYIAVASLLADEDECRKRRTILHGLEEAKTTRMNLEDRISAAAETIQKLEADGRRLWEEISAFQKRYQPVLENKSRIDDLIEKHQQLNQDVLIARSHEHELYGSVVDQWSHLSTKPWREYYGAEISQFPLEQLSAAIERYLELQEHQRATRERIASLMTTQNEVKRVPILVLILLKLIRKTLNRIGRKKTIRQPDELGHLQAVSNEIESKIQQVRTTIEGLFTNLPVEDRLLDPPDFSLRDEISGFQRIYSRFMEAHEGRTRIEAEDERLTEEIRDLASSLGIAADENIQTWIDGLNEKLEDARQGAETALEAKRELQNEIRPVLEATRAELRSLRADLESLDCRLAELGDGSTERGLSLVQEFRRTQTEAELTRQKLVSRYPNFPNLERELKGKGLEAIKIRLEESARRIENQLQDIRSELERLEIEYGRYPAQYTGVDEPIRRFLLYGETVSEDYLANSVLLFARSKSGEKVEEVSVPVLPDRFIRRFRQWWESYRTELELKSVDEEKNPTTGERYRAPQIFLDIAAGEVTAVLPTQRLLRPERGSTVQLEVFGDDPEEPIYTEHLKLYSRSRGLVETHATERFALSLPSEKYVFRLKNKDDPWGVQGINDDAPFLAFSGGTFKRIKEVALPRSRLVLVINEKQTIEPQDCILTEGGNLFGDWREYRWYEIDLTTSEELCLSGENGRRISIPLASDPGAGIALIGGQQLLDIFSNERPVYSLPPESVRIPISDQSDLHLLRFSIISEDENQIQSSKHCQISELISLGDHLEDGWIDIPLTDEQFLGKNPPGCYTLRVYKPPYLDWQTSFCIIPGLRVSFDQEIYLPYRDLERVPDIRALLTIPERSRFEPDRPARLASNDGTAWLVQAPATEDEITGIISGSSPDGESISLPLSVIVPKIRWRLQGLDDAQFDQWFDRVEEELWIGDWMEAPELFLLVELPRVFAGKISLVLLEKPVPVNSGRIQEHKVRFDLKALEDVLRAGPSLETIAVALTGARISIPNIPLFTIRTRWQADNIKYLPYPENNTRRIDISWNAKGRAEQVIVRLWRLSGSQGVLVKDQIVRHDDHEVVFRLKNVEFPSGTYLIHLEPLEPDNPWSPQPIFPMINASNSQLIEITWEIAKDIVTLQSVCVEVYAHDQRIYPLPRDAYKIRVIGKVKNWKLPEDLIVENIDHVLITSYNEDWYVGNLEVNGVPEVIAHLSDTNPVKFEYDAVKHVVYSIEDRHGDGAVYCWDCNMLFWNQETVLREKKKHGKHNFFPIEFKVIWN